MWRKLLNICSSYCLFLKFYAMDISLLPQVAVSINDLKKSPPMYASTLWLSSETFLLPYEVHGTTIFILINSPCILPTFPIASYDYFAWLHFFISHLFWHLTLCNWFILNFCTCLLLSISPGTYLPFSPCCYLLSKSTWWLMVVDPRSLPLSFQRSQCLYVRPI